MTDRIFIRGVRAMGRHGFSHEVHHAQPFDVDVTLELDLAPASASDDLAKTIDYALVVQDIRRTVEQESFALIESLAESIASRLLAYGPKSIVVRVSKPAVALTLGAGEIAVEVRRTAE